MRRGPTLAVITGAALAAVAGSAFARRRLGRRGPEAQMPDEDAMFTDFAPGGPQGFWFDGPIGWAFAKFQPISHAGLYEAVAEVLELQPGPTRGSRPASGPPARPGTGPRPASGE